jgi:hypothetical protein
MEYLRIVLDAYCLIPGQSGNQLRCYETSSSRSHFSPEVSFIHQNIDRNIVGIERKVPSFPDRQRKQTYKKSNNTGHPRLERAARIDT